MGRATEERRTSPTAEWGQILAHVMWWEVQSVEMTLEPDTWAQVLWL